MGGWSAAELTVENENRPKPRSGVTPADCKAAAFGSRSLFRGLRPRLFTFCGYAALSNNGNALRGRWRFNSCEPLLPSRDLCGMHAELTCQLAQRLVAFAGCQRNAHLERRAAPTRHCRCPCGLHLPGHSPEPPHRLKSEPTSNINVLVQISGSTQLSCPPNLSPSKIMQYIKGKSSRKLMMEFKHIQKQFWGRHLWAREYFVASSGNVTDDNHGVHKAARWC